MMAKTVATIMLVIALLSNGSPATASGGADIVFQFDTKDAVAEYLEYLGRRVVTELEGYEIEVDDLLIREEDVFVVMRESDDRDLAYRLLTRVSAKIGN